MPRKNHPDHSKGSRRRTTTPLRHQIAGSGANFRCVGCKLEIPWQAPGTTHRNHCPTCLTSLHVDARVPGDRASDCRGRMAPIALSSRADGKWLIIHECLSCGELSANRSAGGDNAFTLVSMATTALVTVQSTADALVST
nr:RNHCP domain-containing protein [Corynebacterium sputi]